MCVCGRRKTRQTERMRAVLMWMSVEVLSGVRIVQCHASKNVVIYVHVMEFYANLDVVIDIHVMLCHRLVHNFGFSTSCPKSYLIVML